MKWFKKKVKAPTMDIMSRFTPDGHFFMSNGFNTPGCLACGLTEEIHRVASGCSRFHGEEPCRPGDNHPARA